MSGGPVRDGRRPQRGLLRILAGVAGLAVLLAVGGAGVGYLRMTATPDLGPAPRGPLHGDTELALAAWAVTQLLVLNPFGSEHATVTFSEKDLTIVAVDRASKDFQDPEVRVRDGMLVVSGRTSVAGIGVTGVGHLAVRLVRGADGSPDIAVTLDEVDAGDLTLPGFLRQEVADQVGRQVNLDGILEADQRLVLLRDELECVAVSKTGVVLGFHRPLAASDPRECARA